MDPASHGSFADSNKNAFYIEDFTFLHSDLSQVRFFNEANRVWGPNMPALKEDSASLLQVSQSRVRKMETIY